MLKNHYKNNNPKRKSCLLKSYLLTSAEIHQFLRINYCFAGVTGFEPVTNGLALMGGFEPPTFVTYYATSILNQLKLHKWFFVRIVLSHYYTVHCATATPHSQNFKNVYIKYRNLCYKFQT